MQLATFAYEPGMYEILGPWECSLARTAFFREGYLVPSILGYKMRVTTCPLLVPNPEVVAHLHEGSIVLVTPELCTPTLLTTGEARTLMCFGNVHNQQHWGWITTNPCVGDSWANHSWIRKVNAGHRQPRQEEYE